MHLQKLAWRGIHFAQRQTHDFKLMLLRRALHGLATGLTVQYNSIYATLLGADPVQLGSLQSVGNAVGALVALPAGWFIDYYSLKNIFLLGTAMLAGSGLLYFVAPRGPGSMWPLSSSTWACASPARPAPSPARTRCPTRNAPPGAVSARR